jgi:predicted thioredoxin/glutaredoxin
MDTEEDKNAASIQVEVFAAPGCKNCGRAKEVLKKLVEELGGERIRWREVNVVEELDYAIRLGILSTPAIAVDGELLFASLPSEKKLRRALEAKLRPEG